MARINRPGIITREIGMACAVLAIWMLSLLAPLHQTSGLLREMIAAGHVPAAQWSVCVTLAESDEAPGHVVQICPAQGIGKQDLALPPLPARASAPRVSGHEVLRITAAPAPRTAREWPPGQPRAPPFSI